MSPHHAVSTVRRLARLVAGEKITVHLRVVSFAVAASMILLGWQPLLSPTAAAYTRPVFDGVKEIANLQTWGFMFWVCGILFAVAAMSARAFVYIFGVLLSLLTLTAWSASIILEARVNPDAHLTSGALGFYLLSFTAVLGMAFAPQQIAHERQIVGVVEDTEVPLRSVPLPNRHRDAG